MVLGYVSFFFLLLLTIVAFAQPPALPVAELPTPAFLNGVGAHAAGWPSYVFAAAAILSIG